MSKYAVILLLIFIAIGAFESLNISNLALGRASDIPGAKEEQLLADKYITVGRDTLLAENQPVLNEASSDQEQVNSTVSDGKDTKVVKILITAYSSSPEETDDTPLVTASGSSVGPGVVAANFLPFGTKIRLPKLFGDRVFTVEDRMNEKHANRVDVWFPSKGEAINFGQKISEVEIL
jgi:3D (Asp-Asp-Asp) domain-containing protein